MKVFVVEYTEPNEYSIVRAVFSSKSFAIKHMQDCCYTKSSRDKDTWEVNDGYGGYVTIIEMQLDEYKD